MPRTVASPLLLGSADRNELLAIRQHRSTPQSIVLRINIVLVGIADKCCDLLQDSRPFLSAQVTGSD